MMQKKRHAASRTALYHEFDLLMITFAIEDIHHAV